MINDNWDIEICTWCNGEGIDLTFKGNPSHQPPCIRCQGSGKIYVTSEMATTKKRRKYMGAVPKAEFIPMPAEVSSIINEQLAEAVATKPKKRGRPPKVTSGNNPT